MSLRRIRLGSTEPPLKAWYSVPSHVATVKDLKKNICLDIKVLEYVAAENILLSLDDFELLDDSPINVLRDDDLLLLQYRQEHIEFAKRKAVDSAGPPQKKRKYGTSVLNSPSPVPAPAPAAVRSRSSTRTAPSHRRQAAVNTDSQSTDDGLSDSDGSPETNTATSASSSEAGSDSDSDSGTGSSSSGTDTDSSSSPSEEDITRRRVSASKPSKDGVSPAIKPPPVPPGYGKPTTKSRNIRRRRKKQHERSAESQAIPSGLSGSNAVTVRAFPPSTHNGDQSPASPPICTIPSNGRQGGERMSTERMTMISSSLTNKNKRKGFKSHLNDEVPQKIVFSPDGEALAGPSSLSDGHSAQPSRVNDGATIGAPLRLVPPSERQELGQLPANIFVTSVDVEEGLWDGKKCGKGKKKKQVHADEWVLQTSGWLDSGLVNEGESRDVDTAHNVESSSAEVEMTESQWQDIEKKWEALPRLMDRTQLHQDVLLCWKALDINPTTLTPEIMIHISRFLRLEEDNIILQPLSRPVAMSVSFGGALVNADELEELPVWDVVRLNEALLSQWRLVNV